MNEGIGNKNQASSLNPIIINQMTNNVLNISNGGGTKTSTSKRNNS